MEWLRLYVWLEGRSGSIFCLVGRMSINRLLVPLASVWWDPHVMHWSSSSPPCSPLPSVRHLPVAAAGSMPHPLPAAAAGSAAPCPPPSSARSGRTPPAAELRAPRPPDSSRCRPNQFAAARFVALPSSVRGLGPPASPSSAHAGWLRPRLRALSAPVVPPPAPLQAPPHQSSVSHRRSSSLPERRLRALRAPVAPPPAPLQAPLCRSSDPHRRSSSLPERRLRLLHAGRATPLPAPGRPELRLRRLWCPLLELVAGSRESRAPEGARETGRDGVERERTRPIDFAERVHPESGANIRSQKSLRSYAREANTGQDGSVPRRS